MPRALASLRHLAAAMVVVLAGCVSEAPVEMMDIEPPAKVTAPPVKRWLRWQESVSTMNTPQFTTALEGMANPRNANQLFYYGLLRQQSDEYDSWVIARDVFRELQQDETLALAQRQLAGLLERYNQSRINWYHSRNELRQQYEELQQEYAALQQQLSELRGQNSLLEQKIQAITDLEATISTRKEE